MNWIDVKDKLPKLNQKVWVYWGTMYDGEVMQKIPHAVYVIFKVIGTQPEFVDNQFTIYRPKFWFSGLDLPEEGLFEID